MNNVLIFCPTYEELGRDMVRQETLDSIAALDWNGEKTFHLSKCNPYSDGKMNILHQYKHARDVLLAGDYDAMLTVEHDMVIPPDALKLLWEAGEPVAYGVYMLRHGSYVLNTWRLEGRQYVGQSLTLYPNDLKACIESGPVFEISGVGFGCTLIQRNVLEKLEIHEAFNGHPVPDVPFAVDCLRNGFKQVAHWGVQCGHIEPGGNVLWYGLSDGTNMLKIKAIDDVNVDVNGQVVHLTAGHEYDLPEYTAHELQRAGYIRVLTAEAVVKDIAKPVRKRKAR